MFSVGMYVVARVTYISKGLAIILTVQHKLCIMLQFYNKVTGQLAYIFYSQKPILFTFGSWWKVILDCTLAIYIGLDRFLDHCWDEKQNSWKILVWF